MPHLSDYVLQRMKEGFKKIIIVQPSSTEWLLHSDFYPSPPHPPCCVCPADGLLPVGMDLSCPGHALCCGHCCTEEDKVIPFFFLKTPTEGECRAIPARLGGVAGFPAPEQQQVLLEATSGGAAGDVQHWEKELQSPSPGLLLHADVKPVPNI